MGEGSLSQEEIDALLAGASDTPYDSGGGASGGSGGQQEGLSPLDREMVGDIVGGAFSVAANTLGTILAKSASFANPNTESKSRSDAETELSKNTFIIYSDLNGALNGRVVLSFSADNAAKIATAMMGGSDQSDLDEAQLQTLKDSLSPIMGAITAQFSTKLGSNVSGSPSQVSLVNSRDQLVLPEGDSFVRTQLNLTLEGIPSFRVSYYMSLSLANDILSLSKRSGRGDGDGGGGLNVQMPAGQESRTAGQVGLKGVGFPSLSNATGQQGAPNLNLLMDVQMSVTVELGRTKMYIKDILGLGEGSIIELDKLAGEPVDLLVNGKLIAKGEVVVIDENFGVRVTDIVSPADRIKPEGGK